VVYLSSINGCELTKPMKTTLQQALASALSNFREDIMMILLKKIKLNLDASAPSQTNLKTTPL
jgi:hypothetical protein